MLPKKPHGGTCGHCGTAVARNFMTCTGCGATWATLGTDIGLYTIQLSWIIALPVAIVAGMNTRSVPAFVVTFIIVMFFIAWLGTRMRVTRWVR